jgi:hypothetical protein
VSLLGRVQVLSSVVKHIKETVSRAVLHINGLFLSVRCIFVRCKEEEEGVSLLGRVKLLSSVVKHILMDYSYLYCVFLSDVRRRKRV